jgi:hypothetical protein
MRPDKKTDADLKRHQSLFETSSHWSGVAIVAGLALETWLAIEYRPAGETPIQTWGPIAADILVAGGVFFEIMFGRWALHQGGELQQRAEAALAQATERAGRAVERAAEANERAAEANRKAEEEKTARLKLAAEFSARTLSDEDTKKLRDALRDKISRITVVRPVDIEASFLGMELLFIFRQAGIDATDILLPIPKDGYGYPAGIYVMYDPRVATQHLEAQTLVKALSDIDLGPVMSGQGTPVGPTGLPRFPENIPFPWIYIGLKWPMQSGPAGSAWRFMTPPKL